MDKTFLQARINDVDTIAIMSVRLCTSSHPMKRELTTVTLAPLPRT